MKYQKQVSLGGAWVKSSELQSGTKAKLVSETVAQPSNYTNKDGSAKMQDVAKIRIQGVTDPLNVSLNRATINALVDAFGEDSVNWQNQVLTIETEKVRVAGKSVTAMYLIPAGYKKIDDQNGYAMIVKADSLPAQNADMGEPSNPGTDEISVDDIPF